MSKTKTLLGVATVCCAATLGVTSVSAAPISDHSFNEYLGLMTGTDTGSQWFNYYVGETNQIISAKNATEEYGVAGPNGPVAGFDGYLAGFRSPDTGSAAFNEYVDAVNMQIRERQE